VAATPKAKPAASAQRVSGARVLTSAQCVAILKEREEQKKKEQEEKEKRKKEREQKKQEKEIAMKKRAEEREKKAAEKAKKAEELAKKREMKSRKRVATTSAAVSRKKKKTMSTTSENQPSTSRASTSSGATTSEEIDTNQCCVCFQNYSEDVLEGTGLDWVECVCGRWLHEDCISYDIATDANGKELLCPFCCV
jgi:hypothetical protein